MTDKERHERAAHHAEVEGCLCRGPKPRKLCMDQHPSGLLSCTRQHNHEGLHVACAGIEGPHAISSWGTNERARYTERHKPRRATEAVRDLRRGRG